MARFRSGSSSLKRHLSNALAGALAPAGSHGLLSFRYFNFRLLCVGAESLVRDCVHCCIAIRLLESPSVSPECGFVGVREK
jgi:hypothetical protein